MRIAGPVGLGQGLFAIAAAGLAIWSLANGDFAWGAQSVLAGIPWRDTWVHASALILLAASGGLCLPRTAVPSVLTIGAYEAVGIAVSSAGVLSNPLGVGEWYPVCENLTALAGALILYARLRGNSRGSLLLFGALNGIRTAQILFALTCVFYGWSHILYADYTAALVPFWLPRHLPFAYFTGLAHAAAGIAIILGVMPYLAAVLEASMMSSFGLLVWVPSFFMQPRPQWAMPPEHQWSELAVTVELAAAAWIVAISFGNPPEVGRRSGSGDR